MFWRIIGLFVSFLLSMPVLGFAFGMISAKNNFDVAFGIILFLAIVVVWYFLIRWYGKALRRKLRGDSPWRSIMDRRFLLIFALLFAAMNSAACGRKVISPGHVGIVVNSYGANKGVSDYPAVTGVVWYNPITTDVIEYPVFVQNVSWTKDPTEGHPNNEEISFNTGDQMVVYADISLAYQLDAAKAPAFYVKFRADKIDHWTHGFLRNLTRQKFDEIAGKYRIEQIMGDNAPFLKEVREEVQKDLDPVGVHIEQLGFNGSPRPPDPVIEAINGKVRATQDAIRVENEVRQARAQAEKDVAQAEGQARAAVARAEGEAKANQLVNSSLTTNLLEWRRLDIQTHATSKWDGKLPMYTGSAMPLIQLPNPNRQQ